VARAGRLGGLQGGTRRVETRLGLLRRRPGLVGHGPGLLDHGLRGGQLLGERGIDRGLLLALRLQVFPGLPLALGGVGHGLLEPADLVLGGPGAAAYGVDLAAQPGQPFAAVGGGPGGQREPLLLGAQLGLGLRAPLDGRLQQLVRLLQLGPEDELLLTGLARLAFEVFGVAAAALDGGGVDRVPVALGGELLQAGGALAQRRQPEVGLLRGAQPGLRLGLGRLQSGLALLALGQLGLHLMAPGRDRGLVGRLALQRRAEDAHVVGQQPQPGVTQVGLDDGGLAGDLRLAAERLELAAQLGGEVLDAGQVGLHGVELAQRLFLALAVLEHARGLFDEGPPVLGARVQHGVELALPDDDVHLTADARVGQQLLDVEQAADVAVDRVFALPRPEHQPADRDLGVVDRQRAVGVVDGQRDLGAAERRPGRGAGEDDVLHLAAAQRLGAVLAHDPGQGVDDVGLAGAVGADDAGDARLEPQGGRGGEGLEAAQGEGLQIQARPPSP
jgi:hypothetical protein